MFEILNRLSLSISMFSSIVFMKLFFDFHYDKYKVTNVV